MTRSADIFLSSITKDLIEEQRRLGVRASGKSARSLNSKVLFSGKKGIAQLRGSDYWEFQFYGRGPSRGGRGGPGYLQKAIREWLDTKPFASGFDAAKKDSLSWAISKKIHERGTLRGRSSRFPGIDFDKIINKHKRQLLRDAGKEIATRFESDVIRSYKAVN